jgi:hypothetical protein
VSVLSNEDIVGFDIAVNIVHLMHLFDCQNELANIEAGLVLTKGILQNKQA